MPSPFFRLPSSIITCGATLCASVVLLLQNTTACALWLEENLHAMALYSSARDVSKLLQRIGDVVALEQLDHAEKLFSDRVSALLSVQLAESTQELIPEQQPLQDEPTSSTVAEPSVVDDSQPVRTEQGDEKLVEPPSEEVHDTEPADTVRPDNSSTAPDSEEVPSRAEDRPEGEPGETHAEQSDAAETEQASAAEKLKAFWMPGRFMVPMMQRSGSMTDALINYARGSRGSRLVAPLRHRPSEPNRVQNSSLELTLQQCPDPGTEPANCSPPSTPVAAERKAADEVPATSAAQVPPEPSAKEPLASSADQQQEEPPVMTPPMRYRIQMVGDSMMEGLGYVVHSAMRERKGVEFILTAKQSTGLSRPDYFNWPVQLRETMALYKPDLVIFFFGANDSIPVHTEEGIVPMTNAQRWREAYTKKMAEVVQIVRAAGVDLIWIQMPALGSQRYKYMHETQIAQREFCEQNNVSSLLTDNVLSGEWGRFEAFGDFHGKYVRLRAKDTAHLTRDGNKKLVEHLMLIMEQHMARFYAAHPERRLSQEEIARIRRASLVVVASFTSPRTRKKKRMKKEAPDL